LEKVKALGKKKKMKLQGNQATKKSGKFPGGEGGMNPKSKGFKEAQTDREDMNISGVMGKSRKAWLRERFVQESYHSATRASKKKRRKKN